MRERGKVFKVVVKEEIKKVLASKENAFPILIEREKILSSVMGKSAISYIFKRKEQAVTLATKSSIRVEGERVQVDPQLLFQRLVIACMNSDDLGEIFKHEICSYLADCSTPHLPCARHRRQPLLILFGRSYQLMESQAQKAASSTSSMEVLSFTGFHGHSK